MKKTARRTSPKKEEYNILKSKAAVQLVCSMVAGAILYGVYLFPVPFKDEISKKTSAFLNNSVQKEQITDAFAKAAEFSKTNGAINFIRDEYMRVLSGKVGGGENEE